MFLKSCLTLVCSLGLALPTIAQVRKGAIRPDNDLAVRQTPMNRPGQSEKVNQLRRLSQRLARQIDLNATLLNDHELSRAIELLSRASEIVQGDAMTPPPFPQQPDGPQCELYGPGAFAGNIMKYRTGYNGSSKFGTNNFIEMINYVNNLESNRLCYKSSEASCSLVGAGAFAGSIQNYRISFKGIIVSGEDNWRTMESQLQQLIYSNLCRPTDAVCDLAGSGAFAGRIWNHRVIIGGNIIFGTNDGNEALNFLSSVRQMGFCRR